MSADDDERFCPLCDVVLDLHYGDPDDGDECEAAGRRADLVDRFWGMFT